MNKWLKFLSLLLVAAAAGRSPAETILLKGATIHTAAGGVLGPRQLLIKDGKIQAIDISISGKADRVVNLEGQHLYPGLIAMTTTLGLVEIEAVRATRDQREVGDFHPEVESWISVNPDSELLPVARANGITHILPTPEGGVVSGMSGLLALDGWTSEQMLVKAPAALHLFWPSMGLDTAPREQRSGGPRAKPLNEQARERQRKLRSLDDFFLEASAYAKARDKAAEDARVPAWEAMLPFLKREVPLMVHADEYREIKAALNWAQTNKYQIVIAGGRDAWMLATNLAQQQVPVIFERTYNQGGGSSPTPARDTTAYDVHYRAPALLQAAGVKVILSEGLGGDAAAHIRNLPYAAAQAIAFGLPEEEALRALTAYPAEVLGLQNRLGSIAPGREATLIAVDGSIFDIRSHVKRMWIAGREVSLESRHTRLYDKYRQRPR